MAATERDYEGRFDIPAPKGINQAEGDTNVNPEYAYRAENMRTERGMLATGYGTSRAFPALGAPIETLATDQMIRTYMWQAQAGRFIHTRRTQRDG